MVSQDYWGIATVLAGGIATIAIFSYLWRENPLFRFFEHFYIGIASGWGILVTIKNYLWPKLLVPLFALDVRYFPDGTPVELDHGSRLWYLLPLLFGLLFYFIYSRKYSWLAKIAIGLSLGASAGLSFQAFFNQMLPQFQSSFKPLIVFEDNTFSWARSLSNCIFVVTLLSVMYYFFLSFKRTGPGAEKAAKVGRWLMMICFGAFFGSTVMARMALLVERIQFLLTDWLSAWKALFG